MNYFGPAGGDRHSLLRPWEPPPPHVTLQSEKAVQGPQPSASVVQYIISCITHYIIHYITCCITNYITIHFTLHITLRVALHITLHVVLHITLHVALHITLHVALHITQHYTISTCTIKKGNEGDTNEDHTGGTHCCSHQ